MRAAIKSSSYNAKYLSSRLKDNFDFMTSVIGSSEVIFQFASERLRFDRGFVIKEIEARNSTRAVMDTQFLPFTSDKIRDDEDIIKAAITKNDDEFRHASKRIKDKVDSNLEFAKSLLAINCRVFEHFSEKSRDNKDILFAAENEGKCRSLIFQYASKRLRDNVYVVRDVAKTRGKFAVFVIDAATDRIKNNKKIMLEFANQGMCIGYLASKFKDDTELTSKLESLNKINCIN
jgi:hypothetical protein